MKAFILLLAATLTGCGTVTTVMRDDQVTIKNLNDVKTYCGAVPRVYSGVMYDFCSLHAPLPAGETTQASTSRTLGYLVELGASATLDTLALPYTLVRQHQDGSIVLN